MLSGLFLAQVIDRPWRRYIDRKVLHFFYFYVLWLTIQFAFKAPGMAAEAGSWSAPLSDYLLAYIQPFGTLWFIYMLPVMFVITRALREAGVPWQATLAVAAILHIAPVHTGSVLIDEFCSRYVFFFSGYVFANRAFALAAWARENMRFGLAGLGIWALVNGTLVASGLADLPLISLALGTAGALAVIVTAALLTESGLGSPAGSLRRELHRHLPGVLPAHGRDAHRPAQERPRHRYRHHLASGHDRGSDRPACAARGRAAHGAGMVPVPPPGMGKAGAGGAAASGRQPAE